MDDRHARINTCRRRWIYLLAALLAIGLPAALEAATPLTLVEDPAGSGLSLAFGEGAIDVDGELDDWELPLLAGDRVAVGVAAVSGGLNARLELRNTAGGVLTSDGDSGPGSDPYVSDYTIGSSGSYVVRVSGESSTTGGYQVHVEVVRGIDLETDANYANNSTPGADLLTWELVGLDKWATVTGTVMGPESSNTDVDRFALGGVNAGETIELTTMLPSTSTLVPVVRVLDTGGTSRGTPARPRSFRWARTTPVSSGSSMQPTGRCWSRCSTAAASTTTSGSSPPRRPTSGTRCGCQTR